MKPSIRRGFGVLGWPLMLVGILLWTGRPMEPIEIFGYFLGQRAIALLFVGVGVTLYLVKEIE